MHVHLVKSSDPQCPVAIHMLCTVVRLSGRSNYISYPHPIADNFALVSKNMPGVNYSETYVKQSAAVSIPECRYILRVTTSKTEPRYCMVSIGTYTDALLVGIFYDGQRRVGFAFTEYTRGAYDKTYTRSKIKAILDCDPFKPALVSIDAVAKIITALVDLNEGVYMLLDNIQGLKELNSD